ncbi:hypothetical protein WG66_016847 [Moniliophthora roreri]|nr:hypothetical protein WG66_016847 [Moniliophthora roreri]
MSSLDCKEVHATSVPCAKKLRYVAGERSVNGMTEPTASFSGYWLIDRRELGSWRASA